MADSHPTPWTAHPSADSGVVIDADGKLVLADLPEDLARRIAAAVTAHEALMDCVAMLTDAVHRLATSRRFAGDTESARLQQHVDEQPRPSARKDGSDG